MKSYQEAIFGTFQGQNIVSYTFENDLGYRLKVMTYGATVLEYATCLLYTSPSPRDS